jgi:iron(III) transport system permease protein
MGVGAFARRSTEAWLAAAAFVVALAALSPVAFIGWVAVETGWSTVVALVVRPRVGELLVSTVLLLALAVPLCMVVGVGLAWLIERSDLPGKRALSWLAVTPLAIPAFVHSYAWVSQFPGLHGIGAGTFISVLAYFPFLYLPVTAALRRLDPNLEETASALGLSPARVFWRVVFPQLRLALCGGSLLVGLHLLAEYGLFVMIRFDTFTTAIVDQFQSSYNGPAANMLGGVLVLCCVVLVGLESWTRGDRRYARLGAGAARRPRTLQLGWLTLPCLAFAAAVVALSVCVPLVTLLGWLLRGGMAVWRWHEMLPVIGQTIALAVMGSVGATLAAFPIAYLAARAPGRAVRLLEASNYFVGSLPGVIVALALVTIATRAVPSLYQTLATILIAYAMIFLPRALVSLRASIAQVPRTLEEAAGSLGRSPPRALFAVTMRLASPGIASAFALVSLGITNELTATLMLAPNGTQTLATQFWAYTSEIDYAAASPYALLMVLLSLPMTILLRTQSARAAGL